MRPIRLAILTAMTAAVECSTLLFGGPSTPGEPGARPDDPPYGGFEGLRALVVEPESFWGWDAAVFGALAERHFDVRYVKAEALEDFAFLSRFDSCFAAKQESNLKRYVAEGGALYGSWGGPMDFVSPRNKNGDRRSAPRGLPRRHDA